MILDIIVSPFDLTFDLTFDIYISCFLVKYRLLFRYYYQYIYIYIYIFYYFFFYFLFFSGRIRTLESDNDIVFSDRYIPSRAGSNIELGYTVMDGQGSGLDGNRSGE